MSLWDRFRSAFVRDVPDTAEKRGVGFEDFPAAWRMMGAPVAAGIEVNERTALTNSAFWNGVNLISSQIATLPRHVYRRMDDDSRERDRVQPAAKVLATPNPNMTDVVLWETMMAHALTWGNGYSEIEFDRALRPIGLWPITPDRVTPFLDGNGLLKYRVTGARSGVLDAEDIVHIPGLGYDGLRGYSVVYMARQSLGLGLAAERFGAKFFGNGARPQTVLQHPGKLSDEAQNRLRVSVQRQQGGENQLGVMVAEEGMTVTTIGVPPDDAQFLQTRVFEVEEVGRWLNLSPAKLKSKIGERPGGNLEADQINFLTDTLRPWLVRIEQELNRKLFRPTERSTFYVEHNVEALLRADSAARMASYKALVDLGAMTAEQVAQKENLPAPQERLAPLPSRIESAGQLIRAGFDAQDVAKALGLPPMKHLPVIPVTVTPVEDAPKPAAKPPDLKSSREMETAMRAVTLDAVARFARRECAEGRNAAKKGPAALAEWSGDFYGGGNPMLRESILPYVALHMAHAGMSGDPTEVAERLAGEYLERSRDAWESVKATNLQEGVEALTLRWLSLRPAEMAEAIAAVKENSNAA